MAAAPGEQRSCSYRNPPFPCSVVSGPDSRTPDVQSGYHLQAWPIRVPPQPAWISRQNVSLAVVLERRALNLKFSYTFPLNGSWRQRRGVRGERRHGRRSQSKVEALDPEGGRAERRVRSAEAAIISRHHYLSGLEIYANAVSVKNSRTNGFKGSEKDRVVTLPWHRLNM